MKKWILLLLIFLTYHIKAQEYNKQYTYQDAIKLKNIIADIYNSDKQKAFYTVLEKYGVNKNNIDSNIFLKEFKINETLLAANKSIDLKQKNNNSAGFSASSVFSNVFSDSISSFKVAPNLINWQASAVNGLASFMAGRFKQEAFSTGLNLFFKQLNTDKEKKYAAAIFPKTFQQIETLFNLGGNAYYTTDLITLRQIAQLDLERMPENILENVDKIFLKLDNKPEIKDILQLGNHIIDYSKQGLTIDKLITSLASENYAINSKIGKIINLVDLFSQALITQADTEVNWANASNFTITDFLNSQKSEIKMFYGLLYQQLKNVPEFNIYFGGANANTTFIATKIQDLLKCISKFNTAHQYIKAKKFTIEKIEDVIYYLKLINEPIISFSKQITNNNTNVGIALNNEVLEIYNKYFLIVESVIEKNYKKLVPVFLTEFSKYWGANLKTTRTISFVAQLATLDKASEMENLLYSFAMPVGSASVKRNSKFNLTLNGYVGITGGFETAYGSIKNQTKGNIGLSAPIGISATSNKGQLTYFVSFIDLGTIVNQRLKNDTVTYNKLRFEHFITPGLGLYYNFKNYPISLGAHFNYVPNYRTIKYKNGAVDIVDNNTSVTRLNFSILFDLPLFTLSNKSN